MKILLINQVHYRRGGADIVYLNTGDLLKKKGHQVVYFSTFSSSNEPIGQNEYFAFYTDYRKLNFPQRTFSTFKYFYNYEAAHKLKRLIDKEKPDIAHVHLFHGSLSVSVLDALYSKNIPVLHTIHDYRLLCPVSTFSDAEGNICEECAAHSALKCISKKCSDKNIGQSTIIALQNIFHRTVKRKSIQRINLFHFVSEFSKQKHLQYMPEIGNKSKVLYNFTNPPSRANLNSTGNYFLYFGRLSKEKGVKTLLEVFMNNSYSKRLKIVGTGSLFESLKTYSNQKRGSEIDFLGFKTGKELIELIQNAFFVIVPSECYENNPMTIVEAYSYGIPVIGANIGGIPEIIQENKTGYTFELKNHESLNKTITLALNLNEEQYREMRNRAYIFYQKNFSENTHYKALVQLYKKCLR